MGIDISHFIGGFVGECGFGMEKTNVVFRTKQLCPSNAERVGKS